MGFFTSCAFKLTMGGLFMTMRKPRFTNIRGSMYEFASDYLIHEDRHNHREAKSQKAQLHSVHNHGTRKDVKRPIKHKMT